MINDNVCDYDEKTWQIYHNPNLNHHHYRNSGKEIETVDILKLWT